jgi:hypothetical protein
VKWIATFEFVVFCSFGDGPTIVLDVVDVDDDDDV